MEGVKWGSAQRIGVIAGLCLVAPLLATTAGAVPLSSPSTVTLQLKWTQSLGKYDVWNPIAQSSPVEALIGGSTTAPTPAVVVGDRSGRLYALNLTSGQGIRQGNNLVLRDPNVPIDSTPSVARLGANAKDTIFVGLGNRAVACSTTPGYLALTSSGAVLWSNHTVDPPTDQSCAPGWPGVMSGLTLADLQGGQLDAIGMSLGQGEMAFTASGGAPLTGWNPWYQSDSSVSTPAVAKLPGHSGLSVIEGGDGTAGLSYGIQYQDGGHLRIVGSTGNRGVAGPGGTICSYDTYANGGQIIESSPAVGDNLLPSSQGSVGIATGIGFNSSHPSYQGAANLVVMLNEHCHVVWQRSTDYETTSPILADVMGLGQDQVVIGTQATTATGNAVQAGSLSAYRASDGHRYWRVETGPIVGAPVAADLTGQGYADLVVVTTNGSGGDGMEVIDGRTGHIVWTLSSLDPSPDFKGQNSPLITAEPDGHIGITVAGYGGVLAGTPDSGCTKAVAGNSPICLVGRVLHFEVAGSSSTWLNNPLTSWLQFHHDPQLSGNTNGPTG